MRKPSLWLGLSAIGLPLYLLGTAHLKGLPARQEYDALRVVMPAPIQTVLSGGDRYLAANAYVTRAATFGTQGADDVSYEVQGKIQVQAAILNPYQEDNGMLAAAILAWEGQVDRAQWVLQRSTRARDWDPMPPFFQGFNEYYFKGNPTLAGELTALAASRSEGVQRLGLQNMASKFLARSQQPEMAIMMIIAMREATADQNQRRLLGARIQRLEGLVALRRAAEAYRAERGQVASDLQELVDNAYIESIPADPFRLGYVVDHDGVPQLMRSEPSRVQGG